MNLAAAVDRADSVTGPKAAARLYADIEYELAMGEPDSDQEREGEEALHVLENRFPGVKQQADDVVENGHLPNMSRQGWSNTRAGSDDTKPREERTVDGLQTARRRVSQRRARPALTSAGRAGRGPIHRAARSTWRATGIPDATASSAQTVAKIIGWGIGLSLLYLLLDNAQRNGSSSAAALLAGGVTGGIRALVSATVDPLSPGAARSTPARTTAAHPLTGHVSTKPTPARRVGSLLGGTL